MHIFKLSAAKTMRLLGLSGHIKLMLRKTSNFTRNSAILKNVSRGENLGPVCSRS